MNYSDDFEINVSGVTFQVERQSKDVFFVYKSAELVAELLNDDDTWVQQGGAPLPQELVDMMGYQIDVMYL